MSLNTPATSPVSATPGGPVAAPHKPRERRVRFGHLALAIAMVVVGALGTTALVVLVSAEGEYLALARDVEYGAQFTEEDLIVVRITNQPGLEPVAAGDRDRVVGNYAAMPLAAGTLLTGDQVTNQPVPPGQVRVGITLRGDRLPAQPLRDGALVLLVATTTAAVPPGQPAPPPRTWQATVVGEPRGADGGILRGGGSATTTIDVVVAERDAPAVATHAANNELVVVVLPGQGS
jgi:hypothetical protein